MYQIVEEFGGAILGAVGGALICGLIGYAIMDPGGSISALFSGLVGMYL